ncbi:MAG: TonB-dependent receptor, partial [Gemmatimonadetes bacterium]|nr:TonB-dependent receptor [Gemmatimonadota bacterium]NIQ55545.1 TonB-dependent receptor [Gemmatimonadota bacterium]NIU75755.1 TonB-dependent receptor [Gammaproteobacteria bacterium]NIX45402.1 TonB-dependent receptor [Gemmatimonadota bacterium]NIY09694.1 TonB-dependent receptor [Gemmatimonadota bacterium]
YIPVDQDDIRLDDPSQWAALDAFIEQDDYLSEHRGEIAERFGAVNPWYSNVDLRVMQDINFGLGAQSQTLQLNLDVLNFMNLINSDWGVRKVASPAATSPLQLVRFDPDGEPVFDFTGPSETYIDDPGVFSRWRVQLGAKWMLN